MNESLLRREIKQKLNNGMMYDDMRRHLKEMENNLLRMCFSPNLDMTSKLQNTIGSGGKRLRPMLSYFCYRAGGSRPMEIIPLMCMLELMHTASLIHDDVVDDSDQRRGTTTINRSSGKFAAVQYGDFLLARAMENLHIYRGTGINEALAEVSGQMCLGEFAQMENQFQIRSMTQEDYFLQIKRKTAYLLGASCYTGALAGGLSKSDAEAFKNYGENLGIAFQLKDDLLDFTGSSHGKPFCQDIKNGIFTLPLLYLKDSGLPETMLRLLEKKAKTDKEVMEIADYIKKSDAVGYTEFTLRKYSYNAEKSLKKIMECQEKDALIRLAKSMVKRKI